jgi:hypothetical protein
LDVTPTVERLTTVVEHEEWTIKENRGYVTLSFLLPAVFIVKYKYLAALAKAKCGNR